MSNGSTFVSTHCWPNNVCQFDPSLRFKSEKGMLPKYSRVSNELSITAFPPNTCSMMNNVKEFYIPMVTAPMSYYPAGGGFVVFDARFMQSPSSFKVHCLTYTL